MYSSPNMHPNLNMHHNPVLDPKPKPHHNQKLLGQKTLGLSKAKKSNSIASTRETLPLQLLKLHKRQEKISGPRCQLGEKKQTLNV